MSDAATSMPVKTEVDADERVQVKVVDYLNPSQNMEVDSDRDAHVKAKMRDDNGDPFGTESNPIYIAGAEDPGDEIEEFEQSVDVAKDATVTHDYTVTAGKTFKGKQIVVSAAGEFRLEVQLETAPAAGTYNTKYVMFAQAAKPYIILPLHKIFKQAAGAIVRLSITNRDKQTDVYSTLVGIEV